MIRRNIKDFDELIEGNKEVIYIDEIDEKQKSAVAGKIEKLDENTIFVYLVSHYEEENVHEEPFTMPDGSIKKLKYCDIMVFDNVPNEIEGIVRDPIMAEYSRITGIKED